MNDEEFFLPKSLGECPRRELARLKFTLSAECCAHMPGVKLAWGSGQWVASLASIDDKLRFAAADLHFSVV